MLRVGKGTSRMVAAAPVSSAELPGASSSPSSASSSSATAAGVRLEGGSAAASVTSYFWRWNSQHSSVEIGARCSGTSIGLPLCGSGRKQTMTPGLTSVAGA